jgi:hypothetical protein
MGVDVNTELLAVAKKSYTMRLDLSLKDAAERCAEHENRTVTNLIETAVRDYCRERGFMPVNGDRSAHKRANSRIKS